MSLVNHGKNLKVSTIMKSSEDIVMDKRKLKVIFCKSGGTASKGGITTKITLPKKWIDKMNINPEDREVVAIFENDTIVIHKSSNKYDSSIQLDISDEDRIRLKQDAAKKSLSPSQYLTMLWKKDREEYFEEMIKQADEMMQQEDDLYRIVREDTEVEEGKDYIII